MVGHGREGGKGVREGGSRREHPQAVHGHQVLQRDRVIEVKMTGYTQGVHFDKRKPDPD